VARLLEHRQSRDNVEVANALAALAQEVEAGANVMPAIVEAARRGGTVGEIADVLRNQFGEYREPAPW
jgi:methylmalonyl-CoA mutase N-terminal domain/subunit